MSLLKNVLLTSPETVLFKQELGIRISSCVPHNSVTLAGSAITAISEETPL